MHAGQKKQDGPLEEEITLREELLRVIDGTLLVVVDGNDGGWGEDLRV